MVTPSPSRQVVDVIAREEGVSPTELTPPLYEDVDAEALDALFDGQTRRGEGLVRIEFEYRGHDVVVASDGTGDVRVSVTASPEPHHRSGQQAESGE